MTNHFQTNHHKQEVALTLGNDLPSIWHAEVCSGLDLFVGGVGGVELEAGEAPLKPSVLLLLGTAQPERSSGRETDAVGEIVIHVLNHCAVVINLKQTHHRL